MTKHFLKFALILLFALNANSVFSQSNIPQFINFQAVARDDLNNVIGLKPIQIEIILKQGGANGTPVYGAVYEDSTNQLGEFSRQLGTTPTFTIPGIPSDFTNIPWEKGNIWIVIRYKSLLAGAFKSIGAFQYVSVPFSFASKTAEKITTPATSSGQLLTWNGSSWIAQDPIKELPISATIGQTLTWNGTSWIAQTTSQSLPNATQVGQLITWNGSAWIAQNPISVLPNASQIGQLITWNGSAWVAQNPVVEVPAGTITAFGGTVIPTGWAICDGSSQSTTGTYANLFAAIGSAWGSNGAGTFNLPDLRGMFLRGVDGTAGVDPDKNNRYAKKTNGAAGNNVGSYQEDAFQGHTHRMGFGVTGPNPSTITQGNGVVSSYDYGGQTNAYNSDGTNGTPRAKSETRPMNAYVIYIIKL